MPHAPVISNLCSYHLLRINQTSKIDSEVFSIYTTIKINFAAAPFVQVIFVETRASLQIYNKHWRHSFTYVPKVLIFVSILTSFRLRHKNRIWSDQSINITVELYILIPSEVTCLLPLGLLEMAIIIQYVRRVQHFAKC
ncbi:hypothetical protein F4776DRAFT_633131 [Hypoxylon sp. NC0597]|nr:hypothetical protein F4776DRAFT_633131 [Hypoxylon sp. NC0597]